MAEPSQLTFNLDFRPAYGREDFFVGNSNHEAIHVIDTWPDWGAVPFVIVYGDEGSGKQHLASVWKAKSNATVMDAKTFPEASLEEIIADTPNIILHQLHLILGDRELEEKLFHIYNHYVTLEDKRHVLITSRFAPKALETIIPDLESRIAGSRIIRIQNPDTTLLMQVLGKQLNDKGFQPTEDLLNYAVNLMERSWATPKKLSDALNVISLSQQKKLTKKMIRDAIIGVEDNLD